MKKYTSKIIILIMAFSFVAPLSGCTEKCPKPKENIPGTSTYRDDCPYESVDANKAKEINFYFVHDNTDAFKEQIQGFQSKNPGVKVRMKKFVNLQEYEDLVINEIAEGEGPDVFMIHNSWIVKHYKKLLPMPANLPIVMTPSTFKATFFQAAQDDLLVNNKIYGMPLAIDNLAVYYNKSYFKDLLSTADKPADLWSKIKEQTYSLTKEDNSLERFSLAGIAMGRADNINNAVDILYTLMLQYGVDFYDSTATSATFAKGATAAASVSKPGVEALNLYTSFGLPTYKNYSWNSLLTGFAPKEKEVNTFARGKVAMILGYPHLYKEIVSSIQNQQKLGKTYIDIKDIGVAPMPQLVTQSEATKRDTLASYFPLAVARTTKHPTEAWSLVQYLTTADSLQTYHKKTNRPTSRKDMVKAQQVEPIFGVFAYQAPFAKSFKVYDAAQYNKVFTKAIQEVVTNVATAEQALNNAQVKITCIIKKQRGLVSSETDCNL